MCDALFDYMYLSWLIAAVKLVCITASDAGARTGADAGTESSSNTELGVSVAVELAVATAKLELISPVSAASVSAAAPGQ